MRPEKKNSKKQLEAEKKALELREKRMTRLEFIQFVREEAQGGTGGYATEAARTERQDYLVCWTWNYEIIRFF